MTAVLLGNTTIIQEYKVIRRIIVPTIYLKYNFEIFPGLFNALSNVHFFDKQIVTNLLQII